MNTGADVFDFLLPVEPRTSVFHLAETLIKSDQMKEYSPALRDAFAAVEERLTDRETPFIDGNHMMLYRKVRTGSQYLQKYGVPDFIEPLLAVLYLRMKADLQAHGSKSFLRNRADAFRKVKPALAALPADFFGELLVETELRASRDPIFAETLSAAIKELSVVGPRLDALKEQAQVLFMRKKDPELGECTCIVSACNTNQPGDCQDFCIESFWVCLLIFLAFITIIVIAG